MCFFTHSYTKDVMRDGLKNQKKNPEVPADVTRSISLLNEQLFALKALTNLLKNAYQGLDVAWDMDEVFHGDESSGVGPIASSGDGSGEDADSDASAGGPVDPQTPSAATTTTTTVAGPAATTTPPKTGVRTDVDNDDDDTDTDTAIGTADDADDRSPTRGDAGSGKSATLQKALAAYLLPVVAVWFGGSFLEWIL